MCNRQRERKIEREKDNERERKEESDRDFVNKVFKKWQKRPIN